MSSPQGSGSRARHWAAVAAPVLLLLTPFVVFVHFHQYGFARPEIAIIAAGLVIAGVVGHCITTVGGSWLKALFLGGLLAVAIDLQFHVESYPKWIYLASFLAAFLLRAHLAELIVVICLTFVLSSLVLPIPSTDITVNYDRAEPVPVSDLPLMIHLVLDEHIGIEAIPLDVPDGRVAKAETQTLYERYGFRLFGNAYSRYNKTMDAIPNLLNFTASEHQGAYVADGSTEPLRPTVNEYFRRMASAGYRIHVYQTTFMDFCNTPGSDVASCRTFPAESARYLASARLGVDVKLWYLLWYYANQSYAYQYVRTAYRRVVTPWAAQRGWRLPDWEWDGDRVGLFAVMPVFAEMQREIMRTGRGHLIFAHFMMPHHAYTHGAGCAPITRLRDRLKTGKPYLKGAKNTDESRARRYGLYVGQLRCVNTMLDRLLEELQTRGLLDEATVLIHGDHGSRISRILPTAENRDRLAGRDLADDFSTLFAVRTPWLPAGYDLEPGAIEEILADVVHRRDQVRRDHSVDRPAPYVLLRSEGARMLVRHPLRGTMQVLSTSSGSQ